MKDGYGFDLQHVRIGGESFVSAEDGNDCMGTFKVGDTNNEDELQLIAEFLDEVM